MTDAKVVTDVKIILKTDNLTPLSCTKYRSPTAVNDTDSYAAMATPSIIRPARS